MKNDTEMYKKMYYRLFNTITDVIEICPDKKCVDILMEAQKDTEDIYINYYD